MRDLILRALPALALLPLCAAGQTSVEPAFRTEVVAVEIVDAGIESVTLDIVAEVECQRRSSVSSISFHGVRINGMPAYIAPVFEAVELPAGSRVRLRPFRAVLYLRDIASLDPLRTLLQDAQVRITGACRFEIELDWIERLALWLRRGVVWRSFDEALAVAIPGGLARELSSKAFFTLAEPIVQAGLGLRRAHGRWMDQTWSDSAKRLAAVRTTYSLRTPDGAEARAETLATGVFVSPTRIVVPLEAIQPWRFDPATADALERGELKLVGSAEVEAMLPAQGSQPEETFRLSRAEIALEAPKCKTERLLLQDRNGKTRKAKVCRSAGPESLAAIELLDASDRVFEPWPTVLPVEGSKVELTTLRLAGAPAPGGRWWEIVRLQGERVGNEIRLSAPIDGSALGAPLLLEGALLGVIQHERGGGLMSEADRSRVRAMAGGR